MEPERSQSRSERLKPDHERSGRRAIAVLLVAFLVVAGAVVAATSYYRRCGGAAGPQTPVRITIRQGSSGDDVVALLAREGVIRCGGIVGRLLMQNTGQASAIRAGSYDLTTNMTLGDVMSIVTAPPVPIPYVNLTVIPGHRLTQIAEAVARDLGISEKVFLRAAESGDFSLPPYLPAGKPSVEGFLWPETYRVVKKDATAPTVIQKLLDQFATDTAGIPWENAGALGVSEYEIVVIASIIEKEVVASADRELVAAVIYNRLKIGMSLGMDTTVAYIDPDPSNGLTVSDFAIDSPYNTRLNPGLPPTPITSPGLESLQAALQPAKVDYLYFVQCPGEARSRFSTSYDDFLSDKGCLG